MGEWLNQQDVITYYWRGDVADEQIEALHSNAFHHPPSHKSWTEQLRWHSLGWVTAWVENSWLDSELVGFANVAWDGGRHSFLIDVAVNPGHQHMGIGEELVRRAAEAARDRGCEWLHVDFGEELSPFYIEKCGFTPTHAGLLRLT